MIHPYDSVYILPVKEKLAVLIDFMAYYMHFSDDKIQDALINSKTINFLLQAHPKYTVGKSAIELTYTLADEYNFKVKNKYQQTLQKTAEFWSGYYLAFYFWHSNKDPSYLFYGLTYTEILSMYHCYHTESELRFAEHLNEITKNKIKNTNLKIIRLAKRLSQNQLSKKANVKLRSIQLYEQRVNDINKAQGETLHKLAVALDCNMEDLLEE